MKTLIEGRDFYFNEEGLMVFTRAYHINRGFCCGKGCLHCPFNYINVPEPLKKELLKNRDR